MDSNMFEGQNDQDRPSFPQVQVNILFILPRMSDTTNSSLESQTNVSLSNNSSTESSISSTSTSIVSSIVSSISSSISSISSASSASSSESSSSSSSSSTQSRKDIIEQKEVTDFSNHQQTSKISEAILLIMFLLVLNEVLLNWFAKLRLHYSRFWVLRLISPTAITTTLGLLAGLTLDSMSQELLLHDLKAGFSQIFLIVLLPPILFESAINMETAPFFKNFGTINLYAVFGTLIATFITGLLLFVVGWLGLAVSMPFVVCMAFGALISATDPVAVLSLFKQMNTDKNLYALIFGESVLNDAVAIICFDSMIKSYGQEDASFTSGLINFVVVFVGSILIGFLIGVVSAYILKSRQEQSTNLSTSQHGSTDNHTEATIILIVPWVSYLIAQGLEMSGIVSIIFCGISMARYAIPNLSTSGKRQINSFYHALAYNFETTIFLFIGIGFIGFDLDWKAMGPGLLVWSIIGISAGRFVNIYCMTRLSNLYRSRTAISKEWMFLMWFSGLRGAMAYALSLESVNLFVHEDQGNIMLTITLFIVMVNIYVQGTLLPIIVERCHIEEDPVGSLEPVLPSDAQLIFNKLKMGVSKFDEKVLQAHLISPALEAIDEKPLTNLTAMSPELKVEEQKG